MKKLFSSLLLLTFFLSCRGQESSGISQSTQDVGSGTTVPTDPTKPVIAPISEDKCDNQTDYQGIQFISEITDSTATMSWNEDTDSIGFTVFMVENDKLKIMANLPADQIEYKIAGLTEDSVYKMLVRTINAQGSYDCNNNLHEFHTTNTEIFISCDDIHQKYQGTKPSGIYQVDPDLKGPGKALTVYCDMDNNEGGWTRIFGHNTNGGVFENDTEATQVNITDPSHDKYSILSKLDDFKKDGIFTFWLHYPEYDGLDGGNLWMQTSNPVHESITDYVGIKIDYTGMYWGGLEKSKKRGTLIDGSVKSSLWYYAIGSNVNWGKNTIPGPLRRTGITQVFLYIK